MKRQLARIRSLRTNVMLMALGMLVLPQAIVVGWSLMERDVGRGLQAEVRVSAEDAVRVVERGGGEEDLHAIAERWGTRIRLVAEDGSVRYDADADRGTDLVHQVGTLFFGPDGAPTLREFDASLPPVPKRGEVVKATGWPGAPEPDPSPLAETTTHRYPFGPVVRADESSAAPIASAFREPPPTTLAGSRFESGTATGCRTSPAGKLLVCHAVRPVLAFGKPHVLYVQESSRRAVRVLYDLRYHLARLSLVMLPLALVFSWWMGRRMVRPLDWLRERVLEKARTESTHADIDFRGGEEVRDLAEAFNGLLRALDERRQSNEAFVADLVHEFKNPVAAIRSCAESLTSGAADEKRAARISRILLDSSGRLDALVSQFLELARAEAGMPNEDRALVDLGALAQGIVTTAAEATPAVRFVAEVEPSNAVRGVAPRLDSLVRNLVDNAASFAGDGGAVRVTVQRRGDAVELVVQDSGAGIAAEDLPHIFDRFFTTRARVGSDGTDGPGSRRGSGLGLALVKAVAEAHGGGVSAESTQGSGAIFRVRLPAA